VRLRRVRRRHDAREVREMAPESSRTGVPSKGSSKAPAAMSASTSASVKPPTACADIVEEKESERESERSTCANGAA
jgi:hypothetical protein